MAAEKIPTDSTSVVAADAKTINRHLKTLDGAFDAVRKKYFYIIGFGLYWFDDTCAYHQIEGKGYNTIADFAKDRYGISKATTYQYLAVIKKFGKPNPETGEIDAIQDEYKDYSSTALIVMSGMDESQLALCNPDMKIKELKALRDGLLLEDGRNEPEPKGNEPKGDEPKENKPKENGQDLTESEPEPNSNSAKLYTIKDISDFDGREKEIMKSIRKALSQDNGRQYHVDIVMTWDK